jgi:subtilisin family serine protease
MRRLGFLVAFAALMLAGSQQAGAQYGSYGPEYGGPGNYGARGSYGEPVAPRGYRGSYAPGRNQDADAPPPRRKKVTPAENSPAEPAGRAAQRGPTAAPAADEQRLVADEVVIEVDGSPSQREVDALAKRHGLNRVESQRIELTGTTMFRWRIPPGRSVRDVVRSLEADSAIRSAQPNYTYSLQQAENVQRTAIERAEPSQYAVAKLQLEKVHNIARGTGVRVAVIDSGVDTAHPELAGAIGGTFDALGTDEKPHAHGTAVAGLIVAHARLTGVAPSARIFAARAFGATADGAQGTTFRILKSLDWAVAQDVRVINLSFVGPTDPAVQRSLAAASRKGIVLVAAAGNAGPKSPALFPASDPNVIAVSATDADDKLFTSSNRGRHIAVAAPGVDLIVAAPEGGYQISSGTSFSAAQVSGIVALLMERKPSLNPAGVRNALTSSAIDIGPKGRDDLFGAGLADALRAVLAIDPRPPDKPVATPAAAR